MTDTERLSMKARVRAEVKEQLARRKDRVYGTPQRVTKGDGYWVGCGGGLRRLPVSGDYAV
jgi:hypothetical protein